MRAAGACMILAMGVLVGCPGGRAATPPVETLPAPPEPGDDAAATAAEAALDGGAAPRDPAPLELAAGPLTRDECGLLVDKLIAIGLAEQHARAPRAPQATAEQQATIREQLLTQALPTCEVMPRASWSCAMAAADRAAMIACETSVDNPP